MMHFIRLTRPINLLVVALTMYGFGWYLEGQIVEAGEIGVASFEFFLLVFSTVLIAAAGNIINDYFDIRADRINKPERLIIGKYIKKRVAIVTHWVINFLAFSMAVYLSFKLNTFWYVFIHLLSINVLWYYSTVFKRKFLIGNFLVAGLTAMVPILVGLYYYLHDDVVWNYEGELYPFIGLDPPSLIIELSLGLGAFAFVLNLSRELVKDIQDVKGDRVLRAKTVPIIWGKKSAQLLLLFFLLLAVTAIIFVVLFYPVRDFRGYIPLLLSLFLISGAIFFLFSKAEKAGAKRTDLCLKLAMVAGTLSPICWQILRIYG